jgi:hypothetical protein
VDEDFDGVPPAVQGAHQFGRLGQVRVAYVLGQDHAGHRGVADGGGGQEQAQLFLDAPRGADLVAGVIDIQDVLELGPVRCR